MTFVAACVPSAQSRYFPAAFAHRTGQVASNITHVNRGTGETASAQVRPACGADCRLRRSSLLSISDIESRYAETCVAGRGAEHHELLSGLIRLHILHHAAEEGLYGQWMIGELARHGYRISPGTLYPMLHAMERKGYLKSSVTGSGRRARRTYRATAKGRRALALVRERVRELFGELIEVR